jgi:uncharacterized protein (DUF58 family)
MMLVPGHRLIFGTGILLLMVILAALTLPGFSPSVIAVVAAMVAVALFDAWSSRNSLTDIHLELPKVVRLSSGRKAMLALKICHPGRKGLSLRIGLPFDETGLTAVADRKFNLPHQTEAVIDWPLEARRTGRYFLRNYCLETPSRMKLWDIRQCRDLQAEVRVYPDLSRERRHLAAFFLNRGFGLHHQRQLGQGKEFEQLREFLPGDSLGDVHWKATARRGEPITKVYQIERTQQVYVVVDSSRLSARWFARPAVSKSHEGSAGSTAGASVMEIYNGAALAAGLAARRQGDFFGLIVFDRQVRRFLPARAGVDHYGLCRDALFTLDAKPVSPDFRELFTFIGTRLRRRALLIFLTSLDDPVLAEEFCRNVSIVARRHLILAAMIKPPGAEPLFSKTAVSATDDLYDKLGGHIAWRRLRETERVLQRKGVQVCLTPQAGLGLDLVNRYIAIKQRQVL